MMTETPSAFRIVHLSDLHLTANDNAPRSEPRLFGALQGMNAAFRKIVRADAVQDADLLLVTGDVTDRGDLETWRIFWQVLTDAGLFKRTLVVPGNHDVCCLGVRAPWDRGVQADWEKAVAGLQLGHQPTKFPWVRKPDPRVVVFGLSSNNLGNFSAVTNAMGQLGYFQLQRLAEQLHVHRDVPVKIVLLHHSPNIPEEETALKRGQQPVGRLQRQAHQIPQDQRRALRLLCITHRVRLVLHGHLHLAEDRRVGGIRIVGSGASTEPVPDAKYVFCRYDVLGDGGRVTRRLCSVAGVQASAASSLR
jgi:3',5'-cyclic AMP phosphodiesterase CpdA